VAVNSVRSTQKEEKKTIFSLIENHVKLDRLFEDGIPVKYLPRILFVTAILIFYIGNTHHAERTVRKIDKMKIELENIRADYTTRKAELMYASKASEVAKQVAPIGLEESLTPPTKIIIKEGEVILNESVEKVLNKGYTVSGPRALVDAFIVGKQVIGFDMIGGLKSAYLLDKILGDQKPKDLEITKLDLQKMFIHLTNS
jgi:hypothetical protein